MRVRFGKALVGEESLRGRGRIRKDSVSSDSVRHAFLGITLSTGVWTERASLTTATTITWHHARVHLRHPLRHRTPPLPICSDRPTFTARLRPLSSDQSTTGDPWIRRYRWTFQVRRANPRLRNRPNFLPTWTRRYTWSRPAQPRQRWETDSGTRSDQR